MLAGCIADSDILFPCSITTNHPISQTHIGPTKGGTYNEYSIQNLKSRRDASELLFIIFRRKEVKAIVKGFVILSGDNLDYTEEWCIRKESHVDQLEKIFGNSKLRKKKPIPFKKYFIDGGIEREKLECEEFGDIMCRDYRAEDDSKSHIVIFDVSRIDREYLHQRIRCLRRKDNVFAVLMVKKGACCNDINFCRDERSNIMAIEFKMIWKGNFEFCTLEYLRGMCLSWYDEKCKEFMTKGLDKIFVSHK